MNVSIKSSFLTIDVVSIKSTSTSKLNIYILFLDCILSGDLSLALLEIKILDVLTINFFKIGLSNLLVC